MVEFSILFAGSNLSNAGIGITIPYFFDKITTLEQRSLPISDRFRDELSIGYGSPNVQRAFVFRNQVIFTVRNPGFNTALVYKYLPSSGLVDVCYLASEEAADRVRSHLKGH
jgi:hypothetical protein